MYLCVILAYLCVAPLLQEDNFMPQMTALETIAFYAELILPASMAPNQRRERSMEVLEVLGLAGKAKTMVRHGQYHITAFSHRSKNDKGCKVRATSNQGWRSSIQRCSRSIQVGLTCRVRCCWSRSAHV